MFLLDYIWPIFDADVKDTRPQLAGDTLIVTWIGTI